MRNINQTLAEQLQINDHEIAYRKSMIDFSDNEITYLVQAKPYINTQLDNIVAQFYKKQIKNPEIALLIGDSETLSRLQNSMRHYIQELFDGEYGSAYIDRRLRIGKVHWRIGVSPKLYISAIWLLQTTLFGAIDNAPENYLNNLVKDKTKLALNKLLMLDTQFVFDTYISSLISEIEVEVAHEALQKNNTKLDEMVNLRTQQLQEISRKDALTKLYNQHAFYAHLRREISASDRHQDQLSLVYFDLNNFKRVNDAEGHQNGDRILKHVGDIVLRNIRDIDIGCRYGGDEFAIILPRTTQQAAMEIMQRVITDFKNTVNSFVTFSIGISTTGPEQFVDAEALVKEADQLMYQSKAKAKNKNDFYITISDENYGVRSQPQREKIQEK